MARSLNSHCDFKEGFFTYDLPIDVVELVLKVITKCGKHTLKEDIKGGWKNTDLGRDRLMMMTPVRDEG